MTNSAIRLFALPLTRASETDCRKKCGTSTIDYTCAAVYSVSATLDRQVKGIRHTHFAEFQIKFLEYCVMLLSAYDGM